MRHIFFISFVEICPNPSVVIFGDCSAIHVPKTTNTFHYFFFFLLYSDQIVQQVLDELVLQIEGDLSAIPSTGSSVAQAGGAAKQPVAAGGVNDADADLEARLDALRRN